MTFISVTRLRVRSVRYLPQFIWRSLQSVRQTERAAGFVAGKVLREARNAFWTVTAWEDAAAMNAFRIAGAHLRAMPKLLEWCDEASVVHWNQETAELPNWMEAHRRLVAEGKASKVNHPSAEQKAFQIAAPQPGRIVRTMRPVR
jgi:hypothetical protein